MRQDLKSPEACSLLEFVNSIDKNVVIEKITQGMQQETVSDS